MIRYPVGESGQTIVLAQPALDHVLAHSQKRWWQAEAGGQLFAHFVGDVIEIVEATGPRPTDRRGRHYYEPDARAERAEIAERHALGLHFVGDWHTHAEVRPQPSGRDLASISESVRRSHHGLNGFVLMVVGTAPAPAGIHLSIHDGVQGFALQPEGSTDGAPRALKPRPTIVWV